MPKGRFRRFSAVAIVVFLLIMSPHISSIPTVKADRPGWTVYTPKDQMIAQWKTLCDAHPEEASYESIGKTVQGRDIWLFKIGNPSGATVMYDGEGHGGEDGGTETLYVFAKWLLESNESQANHILDKNYHLIIPILNMDTTHRQNMRRQYILENGTIVNVTYGVDLNRNSLYNWGRSGSSDPLDNYSYRGLYAGSEPETMAYHNAVAKYLPIIYVNTHVGDSYMMTYSNTTFEQEIGTLITEYRQQYDINFSYPTRYSRSGGGFIAADADNNFGASGWLWELCYWDDLTPTLDPWLEIYYPRVFPVFLAFAQAAENKQSSSEIPNPTPTPSPSPPPSPSTSTASKPTLIHNIAVTNLTWSRTTQNDSETLQVQVDLANKGNFEETFNLTVYANELPIASTTTNLQAGKTTTSKFEIKTQLLAPGNYTITANAQPVQNETDETDNFFELESNPLIIAEIPFEPTNSGKDTETTNSYLLVIVASVIIAVILTTTIVVKKRKFNLDRLFSFSKRRLQKPPLEH